MITQSDVNGITTGSWSSISWSVDSCALSSYSKGCDSVTVGSNGSSSSKSGRITVSNSGDSDYVSLSQSGSTISGTGYSDYEFFISPTSGEY